MLTHHTGFEQRTESWDRARRGYITASSAKRLVTAGGKESSQWRTYAAELATEIFLAENISSFHGNQHTKRGEMLEKPAQEWFARQLGIQSIPESALPAFVCDEETQCGFSPDMLFPEYGVETKAQEAKKHFTDILGWRNGKDRRPGLLPPAPVLDDGLGAFPRGSFSSTILLSRFMNAS